MSIIIKPFIYKILITLWITNRGNVDVVIVEILYRPVIVTGLTVPNGDHAA